MDSLQVMLFTYTGSYTRTTHSVEKKQTEERINIK